MRSFIAVSLFVLSLCFSFQYQDALAAAAGGQTLQPIPPGTHVILPYFPAGSPLSNPSDLTKLGATTTSPAAVRPVRSSATTTQAAPAGNSCFAYYHFGSVNTTITSQTPITTAGVPLALSAVITNSNDYPIVGGALYVKVFKTRPDGQTINGPAVVDQFFATDSIDLAANGSTTIYFTYNIPAYAETGDYEIGTYFTTDKKFNLSGLSFTDDVVGNQWDFSVRSGESSGVEFDKDKVTVASSSYYFASYPPTESRNAPIYMQAPITNTTDTGQVAKVDWVAYSWDAQLQSNIVATDTQLVALDPHSTQNATFVVTDAAHPVYLVVGTLTYKDTKSIVNIRFARGGVDQARLNFPAVTSFPLQAGATTTLFSCVYNSGLSDVIPPQTLELDLVDAAGHVFEHFVWKEPITSAMMLARTVFKPNASYDDFMLKATLTDMHGNVVDSVVIPYDCKAIDPALCFKHHDLSSYLWLLIIVLVILVIFAIVYAVRYRARVKRKK